MRRGCSRALGASANLRLPHARLRHPPESEAHQEGVGWAAAQLVWGVSDASRSEADPRLR